MINEQIVEQMQKKYGLEKTLIFCELQAYYFRTLASNFSLDNPGKYNEYVYYKDWFEEKSYILNKLHNEKIHKSNSEVY